MKHVLAVAVMEGFTGALGVAVEEGKISMTEAGQITRFAAAISREYIKGNTVLGHKLEFFSQDGQAYEDMIQSEKINLNKWGE